MTPGSPRESRPACEWRLGEPATISWRRGSIRNRIISRPESRHGLEPTGTGRSRAFRGLFLSLLTWLERYGAFTHSSPRRQSETHENKKSKITLDTRSAFCDTRFVVKFDCAPSAEKREAYDPYSSIDQHRLQRVEQSPPRIRPDSSENRSSQECRRREEVSELCLRERARAEALPRYLAPAPRLESCQADPHQDCPRLESRAREVNATYLTPALLVTTIAAHLSALASHAYLFSRVNIHARLCFNVYRFNREGDLISTFLWQPGLARKFFMGFMGPLDKGFHSLYSLNERRIPCH